MASLKCRMEGNVLDQPTLLVLRYGSSQVPVIHKEPFLLFIATVSGIIPQLQDQFTHEKVLVFLCKHMSPVFEKNIQKTMESFMLNWATNKI